ncbi:MAG: hypothetical protein KAT05_06715, partial [Spirochaetes bacterium]|nr:hypothetical protein [Spirochaetota bacterium]
NCSYKFTEPGVYEVSLKVYNQSKFAINDDIIVENGLSIKIQYNFLNFDLDLMTIILGVLSLVVLGGLGYALKNIFSRGLLTSSKKIISTISTIPNLVNIHDDLTFLTKKEKINVLKYLNGSLPYIDIDINILSDTQFIDIL